MTDPAEHETAAGLTAVSLAVFWLIAGYRYFVNAGIETVPLIERHLDPTYLVNDYYLNITAGTLHHRFAYVELLGGMARMLGGVETAMIVAYSGFHILLFAALTHLSRYFAETAGQRAAVALLTPMLVYFVVARANPGAIFLLPNEMIANLIVRGALLWCVVLILREQFHWAMALLCAGAMFHPLEALLAYPFLTAAAVHTAGPAWRARAWRCALWFVPLAAIALFLSSSSLSTDEAARQALGTTFVGRLKHHYVPWSWPLWHWLFLAGLAGWGTVCLRARHRSSLTAGCLVSLFLFAGYIAVLGLTGSTLLLALQGAKVMILPYFVWTLAIAADLAARVFGRWRSFTPALRRVAAGSALASVAALIATVFLAPALLPGSSGAWLKWQAAMVVAGNYRTAAYYVDSRERALYGWLEAHTAPGDVVLHPPELQMIRPLAQRSSVVQLKLTGFTPEVAQTWLTRMSRVGGYCGKALPELRRIAGDYGASWIVIRRGCAPVAETEMVYGNTGWIVVPAAGAARS